MSDDPPPRYPGLPPATISTAGKVPHSGMEEGQHGNLAGQMQPSGMEQSQPLNHQQQPSVGPSTPGQTCIQDPHVVQKQQQLQQQQKIVLHSTQVHIQQQPKPQEHQKLVMVSQPSGFQKQQHLPRPLDQLQGPTVVAQPVQFQKEQQQHLKPPKSPEQPAVPDHSFPQQHLPRPPEHQQPTVKVHPTQAPTQQQLQQQQHSRTWVQEQQPGVMVHPVLAKTQQQQHYSRTQVQEQQPGVMVHPLPAQTQQQQYHPRAQVQEQQPGVMVHPIQALTQQQHHPRTQVQEQQAGVMVHPIQAATQHQQQQQHLKSQVHQQQPGAMVQPLKAPTQQQQAAVMAQPVQPVAQQLQQQQHLKFQTLLQQAVQQPQAASSLLSEAALLAQSLVKASPAMAADLTSQLKQMTAHVKQQQQQLQQQQQQHGVGIMMSPMAPQQQMYAVTPQFIQGGSVYSPRSMYTDVHSPSQFSDPSLSPLPFFTPKTYKTCVVCSAEAKSFHFGVRSCKECKDFFRHSVKHNIQYTCLGNRNCPINTMTRNCQFCHFQKCVAAGMSVEEAARDRNKKQMTQAETFGYNENLDMLTEKERVLLQGILQAHKDSYPEDDEAEKKKELSSENLMIWERVTELSSKGATNIVKFAMKVPGFVSISPKPDQTVLLKAACLEIMILRLCSRYNIEQDALLCSGGISITKEHLNSGGFGSLADAIFKLARSLKVIDLDEMEYAVLSAIMLISGDRFGLEGSDGVDRMQQPIVEALKHYVRLRRRNRNQPHAYAKMLMKIADLRELSVKGAERLLHLRLEMPGEVPRLLIEMLDREENTMAILDDKRVSSH